MISHHLQSIYSKKEKERKIRNIKKTKKQLAVKLLNLGRVVFVFMKSFQ